MYVCVLFIYVSCVCGFILDFISFSTSKENYLLMYYIIHSVIMSNHRRLLHVNNYIFKSTLLEDAPGNDH